MRGRLPALLLLGAMLTVATAARSSDLLLQAIDDLHRSGKISHDERILYRVTAVRAPEQLPGALRQLTYQGPSRAAPSGTAVLLDAFRQLDRLPPAVRDQVQALLDPPPPLSYSVERDDVFPFRVSYGSPTLAAKAEQVLQAAEISYQKEVEQWGFWAPDVEPTFYYYEIFLMDPGLPGAAGYTSPYLENNLTTRADTYSYIVIGDSYDGVLLDSIVAHEFNHACQVAMDASEQLALLENTATYIETAVFPASWPYNQVMFPAFQGHPYRPLEFSMPGGSSDGYEYGGALWVHFLEHLYGADDPSWIRQIWEGSIQDGWSNEPDYFDVIDETLAAEGGLTEAVRTFARYRFYVGTDDDGQHLPDSWQWGGAEIWRTAAWTTSQLPLIDKGPADVATRPRPNGCNYISLNVDNSANLPVLVSFNGGASLEWYVTVLEGRSDQSTGHQTMAVDGDGLGELSVSLEGLDELTLVICQLSGAGYDPDDHQWLGGSYHYSMQWDIPAPAVTSASPDEIEQGAHGVAVTITGEGFYDHEDLTVSLTGDKVAVTLEEVVSPTELRVLMTVAPGAALGPRDIIVENPGGAAGVGAGLMTIVAPEPGSDDINPEAGQAEGSGCACAVPSSAPAPGPPLAFCLALALGLYARRRRCRQP